MWTLRFLAMTALAVGLAVGFAVLGYLVALDLVQWRASFVGAAQIFTGLGVFGRVSRATAIVFAAPPVVAWVAVLIRAWRGGVEVRTATALGYLAIPLVALAGAILLTTWGLSMTITDASPNGLRHMIDLESVGVGSSELQIAFVVALGLWVAVAVRTPDKPR